MGDHDICKWMTRQGSAHIWGLMISSDHNKELKRYDQGKVYALSMRKTRLAPSFVHGKTEVLREGFIDLKLGFVIRQCDFVRMLLWNSTFNLACILIVTSLMSFLVETFVTSMSPCAGRKLVLTWLELVVRATLPNPTSFRYSSKSLHYDSRVTSTPQSTSFNSRKMTRYVCPFGRNSSVRGRTAVIGQGSGFGSPKLIEASTD